MCMFACLHECQYSTLSAFTFFLDSSRCCRLMDFFPPRNIFSIWLIAQIARDELEPKLIEFDWTNMTKHFFGVGNFLNYLFIYQYFEKQKKHFNACLIWLNTMLAFSLLGKVERNIFWTLGLQDDAKTLLKAPIAKCSKINNTMTRWCCLAQILRMWEFCLPV